MKMDVVLVSEPRFGCWPPPPYGHKTSGEQEFLHLFISLDNYFHLWTGIPSMYQAMY